VDDADEALRLLRDPAALMSGSRFSAGKLPGPRNEK